MPGLRSGAGQRVGDLLQARPALQGYRGRRQRIADLVLAVHGQRDVDRTAGGAQVLRLDGVGTLEVGKAADVVIYDIDHPRFHGFHDIAVAPVAAGEPIQVRHSIVQGRVVVDNGQIPGLDLARLRADAHAALQIMLP